VASPPYFVATDDRGIEHAASGPIHWNLTGIDTAATTRHETPLTLRDARALLEVLDECVFLVTPIGDSYDSSDGTTRAEVARVVRRTSWGTGAATRFALECAEHLVQANGEIRLPNGTGLTDVIARARTFLDGDNPDHPEQLGELARLRALRRLRHEREEVSGFSLGSLLDDERRGVDALDDPEYATVLPVIDAVLATIEALRHHALSALYTGLEDAVAKVEGDRELDHPHAFAIPAGVVTPFGNFQGSTFLSPRYEPSWVCAREAARHARLAVHDLHGETAERAELSFQAELLGKILTA